MTHQPDARPPEDALRGSLRGFRDLKGADLLRRVEPFFAWQDLRRSHGLWPYARATEEAPQPICSARDDSGNRFRGVNFGSQDYLGLASHLEVKAAAIATIEEYGVHSAGSSALCGNTSYSLRLEAKLAEFLQVSNVVLYPTGWAAGYGVIRGLVRPADHIVMDALAHACLQEGAAAATQNVHLHRHLDLGAVRRLLGRIRERDNENAILVVTESLFSMDSDTPDLAALQELCHAFGAFLLVDCAHDLGCLGPDGTGHLGAQDMLGRVDLVMGSFSKTFASNGGFVATNSPAVAQYLRYYGSSATFSNALSPVQCATVLKALEIVRSGQGNMLRRALMDRVTYLRDQLQRAGFSVVGDPSAIVPVQVGDEAQGRLISRRLPALGVLANLVEYPAVARGQSRFRLQVMARHARSEIDDLVVRLRRAVDDCTDGGFLVPEHPPVAQPATPPVAEPRRVSGTRVAADVAA